MSSSPEIGYAVQAGVDALASGEAGIRNMAHELLTIRAREDKIILLGASLCVPEFLLNSQPHVFGKCDQ